MTGGELQAAVTGLAGELGIWWAHLELPFPDPDRRHGHAGWVDLILLGWHGGRFAEIKASGDKRSRAQLDVATRLRAGDLPYRLWTPRHWHDGAIRADLEAIR